MARKKLSKSKTKIKKSTAKKKRRTKTTRRARKTAAPENKRLAAPENKAAHSSDSAGPTTGDGIFTEPEPVPYESLHDDEEHFDDPCPTCGDANEHAFEDEELF